MTNLAQSFRLKSHASISVSNLQLEFGKELCIDLFAGAGGASRGIACAYREPDIAVNHDPIAIAVHRANHPDTEHFQCDVFEVDPLTATRGRPVGLIWASPDCRDHSKAKGGAPRSKRVRGLAWVILHWAYATSARLVEMENVEEFRFWAPLDSEGKRIKERQGETFQAFIAAMTTGLYADHPAMQEIVEFLGDKVPVSALVHGLGYTADWREIRACRKGAPTTRRRLVVKFRRDGKPITWSEDTYGAPDSPEVQSGKLLPYRTAAECIDWELPACSIFADKAEAKAWARALGMKGTPKRPLERTSKRRIAKGVWRYSIAHPKPFIVPLRGAAADHHAAHSVLDPLSTVSAGGTHHELVQTAYVATNTTGHAGGALSAPLHTITTGGHHALVLPSLVETAHADESPTGVRRWGEGTKELDLPMGAIQAGGGNFALSSAHVVKYRGDCTGHSAECPLPVITAGGEMKRDAGAAHALGVATAHFVHMTHQDNRDGYSPTDPMRTVTGAHRGEQAVVTAQLAAFGQNAMGSSPGEPMQTALAGASRFGLVCAHLEQAAGGPNSNTSRPRDIREPTSTITVTGSQQQLVTAYFVKSYSQGGQWSAANAPLDAITTKDRMGLVEVVHLRADIVPEPLRARARQVAAFLHEFLPEHFPSPADYVLVGDYVMVDITLRMLVPRELARGQGFPDSYIIDRGLFETAPGSGQYEMRPISKTAQVRLIGNSVCPHMAQAEIENDLRDLIDFYDRKAA